MQWEVVMVSGRSEEDSEKIRVSRQSRGSSAVSRCLRGFRVFSVHVFRGAAVRSAYLSPSTTAPV